MIEKVNKSGVLMEEVQNITSYWFGMKAKGLFYDEEDAFFQEEDYAREIVYAVRCWVIKRRGPEIDDKTLKEFVGILLGQRL